MDNMNYLGAFQNTIRAFKYLMTEMSKKLNKAQSTGFISEEEFMNVIMGLQNSLNNGLAYLNKEIDINVNQTSQEEPESLNNQNNLINCNRNMNRNRKNVVRLTESKLRNMIKESVRQILREAVPEYGMKSMQAYGNNQQYSENYANSLRRYWSQQGLTGDALERKVQQILHRNANPNYNNYRNNYDIE